MMISAAFILPDEADVRAILLALHGIDLDAQIHASINPPERFTPHYIFWTIAEGPDARAAIDAAIALLPTFGLTYTQV